jgi:hypothetical protein
MAQPAYGRLSKELIQRMSGALSVLAEAHRLLPVRRPERPVAEGRVADQRVGVLDRRIEDQGDERGLGERAQDELHGELRSASSAGEFPARPPILPKDFGGVGTAVQAVRGEILTGPAPFPEPGELTKPWTFMGKNYNV